MWVWITVSAIILFAFVVVLLKRRATSPIILEETHNAPELDTQLNKMDLVDNEIDEVEPEFDDVDKVVTISVFADKNKTYAGYDLLQTLLANGLRFGKYDIFHYMELDKTLFSLAQATTPGTFDIDNMAAFSTPGLTLFMQIDHDGHLETSFDKMLQTAQIIAADLGGYIVDQHHEELSDTRIQEIRKWLRRVNHADPSEGFHDNTI